MISPRIPDVLSGCRREKARPMCRAVAAAFLTFFSVLSPLGATTYFVGGAGCSDIGPGDASTPFCTFDTALAQLSPGDTLVIKTGIYTNRLVADGVRGSPEAPIIICSEQPGTAIFDGGCLGFPCELADVSWQWDEEAGMVELRDCEYVTLCGLTVRNAIAAGLRVHGGTAVAADMVTIDGTGNAGLLFTHTTDLAVARCDVGGAQQGWRDLGGILHPGAHEALSLVAVDQFLVAHNYVHDTLKEGIDVKEGSTNGEVRDNFVERACAVGIYINEAHDVCVYRNGVRNTGYFLRADGQERLCEEHPVFGPQFGQFYGDGILLAVGDLDGPSPGLLSNIQVYQNVVWGSHGNGLQFWDELRERGTGMGIMSGNGVYNNVFYGSAVAGIWLDDVTDTTVANNIVALNQQGGITGNAVDTNTVTHNLFHLLGGGQQPAGANAIIGDPLFADPGSGDFHLHEDSPAIDQGVDIGLPFSGVGPDLGRHEFGLPPEWITERPQLLASWLDRRLGFAWPISEDGFVLESRDNLLEGSWSALAQATAIIGGRDVTTVTVSGRQQFYRLRSP